MNAVSRQTKRSSRTRDAAKCVDQTILKSKVVPKLWIVVPGDEIETGDAAVRALTSGNEGGVDISLLQQFVQAAKAEVQYVKDWKVALPRFPHIMFTLDVRVFFLPPNVATAAVRLFGDADLRSKLKQPAQNSEVGVTALQATRLYKALAKEFRISTTGFAGNRSVGDETENEYRRVHRTAKNSEKPLNKALALLIQEALTRDGVEDVLVIPEKRNLAHTNLQPDIQIHLPGGSIVCVEPTWRSAGKGIEGEFEPQQKTLTEAHLRKYILDKAMEYMKALGL
jgi:hypothetical protein